MKAYLILKTGFYRQGLFSEALLEYDGQAEKEAEILSGFATLQEALVYAKEHPVGMQLFIETIKDFVFQSDRLGEHQRLTVMGFETEADLLVRLDYLWNHAVRCLKQNRRVWVFVECVDELLYSGASGEGILVTPSANIAVNDRFEETDSEFYKIFL